MVLLVQVKEACVEVVPFTEYLLGMIRSLLSNTVNGECSTQGVTHPVDNTFVSITITIKRSVRAKAYQSIIGRSHEPFGTKCSQRKRRQRHRQPWTALFRS